VTTVRRLALALAAAGWLGAPPPAAAQVWSFAGADGALERVHFHATGPGVAEALSGYLAEGRGGVSLGPVSLLAAYGQGHLTPDSGGAAARDLVTGSVLLAARPTSWLRLAAGPSLCAYSVATTVERWVHWEVHARLTGPVIVGTLRAHAEGWVALASSVNAGAGAGGAAGGEAGLTVLVPRTPLWARFAYVVDQARLENDARTETLERVVLSVGLGAR